MEADEGELPEPVRTALTRARMRRVYSLTCAALPRIRERVDVDTHVAVQRIDEEVTPCPQVIGYPTVGSLGDPWVNRAEQFGAEHLLIDLEKPCVRPFVGHPPNTVVQIDC